MIQKLTCAADSCECQVDPAHAVRVDNQAYCSQRCAEGRGCDHADCNCGDFPAAEPEPTPQRT